MNATLVGQPPCEACNLASYCSHSRDLTGARELRFFFVRAVAGSKPSRLSEVGYEPSVLLAEIDGLGMMELVFTT